VTLATLWEAADPYHRDVGWTPILGYRDFYDVPRMILVRAGDRWILLDCPFDDDADEYSLTYKVYELASDPREAERADWRPLPDSGRYLDEVLVDAVEFDETRRAAIRSQLFAAIVK
jgi:hypothetical protein